MERQKSMKNNMLMSSILTVSNFIFPLITYSYVSRVLTPIGTGKVAFVNSILQYFSYIAILGIPSYGLRECAKVRDDKEKLSHTVQELLIISLVSTLIAYVLLIVSILSVPKLFEYKDLFAVMSAYILLNTIGLEWVYQALEEYSYITKRSIFFKCIGVILTFLLIRTVDDFLWYGFISIFTVSASYIFNFINIHKHVSLRKKEKYNLKKHLKPIMTLFWASIIITIYANFDVSMIGFISTENEVGLYNAALKIKSILLSLSTAVTSVIIPRISYYLKNGQEKQIKELATNSMRISMLFAMPIAVYVFIYSRNVINFVCGEAYLGAVSTLRILMICIIPLIMTNIFGNQLLIPMGKEKRFSQSVFIGMWINLVLNFLLIPPMGAFGAAIGTLITECWNAFWMSAGVKTYRDNIIKDTKFCKYIFSVILAFVLSLIIYQFINKIGIFYQLFITAIVFFGGYYILLLVLKEPLLIDELKKIKNKFFYKNMEE